MIYFFLNIEILQAMEHNGEQYTLQLKLLRSYRKFKHWNRNKSGTD